MRPVATQCVGRRGGRAGSALILTVVLTTLLALVGVLFVMLTRIDKISSSAVAEHRELNFAVDSVVAEIGELLVLDVPGAAGQEYYDYPDVNDRWLADLEPNRLGGAYTWRQISDIMGDPATVSRNVRVQVVGDHDAIKDFNSPIANADADGDGVGDSKWVRLEQTNSSAGKDVYAAVRIIDNGAMLNMNTGFKLDPVNIYKTAVDGRTQLHVNVVALGGAPGSPPTSADEVNLLLARANYSSTTYSDLRAYERNVIWYFGDPNNYTPFDLSDELELRFRYLLNNTAIDTRLESWGRFRDNTISTPVDSNGAPLDAWFRRARIETVQDPNYAYRHIATTMSMDRVIHPGPAGLNGGKMVNVNIADVDLLFEAVRVALLDRVPVLPNVDAVAAQIAVNIKDYIDDDNFVTVLDRGGVRYYGYERPCVYISELASRWVTDQNSGQTYRSYAIELYKPYFEDVDPGSADWDIYIDFHGAKSNVTEAVRWSGTRRFHVIRKQDSNALLSVAFSDPCEPADTSVYGYVAGTYSRTPQDANTLELSDGATISLRREVAGQSLVVDEVNVPSGWIQADGQSRSIQRDISNYKCIRRLWAAASGATTPTLGSANTYVDTTRPQIVQEHPANQPFVNIGELGMILRTSGYRVPAGATEADLRIDLCNPATAGLFWYLTVFDPSAYGWGPSETRVKGRVNINTAPAFVLAQLPWMQYGDASPLERALAVVAYRKAYHTFKSIADLMQVPQMLTLASDYLDNLQEVVPRGPDVTNDMARDDFEERDLIFTRISNLITVRSDVFTAYILVRLGVDGPQKRVVAIFDRSYVRSRSDPVRLVVVQPVPDPR